MLCYRPSLLFPWRVNGWSLGLCRSVIVWLPSWPSGYGMHACTAVASQTLLTLLPRPYRRCVRIEYLYTVRYAIDSPQNSTEQLSDISYLQKRIIGLPLMVSEHPRQQTQSLHRPMCCSFYLVLSLLSTFSCSQTRVLQSGKNSIFGKVGRLASEEVIIHLIKYKCMPVLLYGLQVLNLNKSQLNSLDFVANRFSMKHFSTNNMQVVELCTVNNLVSCSQAAR